MVSKMRLVRDNSVAREDPDGPPGGDVFVIAIRRGPRTWSFRS